MLNRIDRLMCMEQSEWINQFLITRLNNGGSRNSEAGVRKYEICPTAFEYQPFLDFSNRDGGRDPVSLPLDPPLRKHIHHCENTVTY